MGLYLSFARACDVEGLNWKKAIYKHLWVVVEGFNGRAKNRVRFKRLT